MSPALLSRAAHASVAAVELDAHHNASCCTLHAAAVLQALTLHCSYTAYFFYGVGLLSGSTIEECKEEVKHKFIPTFAAPALTHLVQLF